MKGSISEECVRDQALLGYMNHIIRFIPMQPSLSLIVDDTISLGLPRDRQGATGNEKINKTTKKSRDTRGYERNVIE